MKIVVAGTRGIPDILGGVETHCENLFPLIAAEGEDIAILRRSCYITPENRIDHYRGIRLIDLYAPRKKSIEAIVHSLLAVVKARRLHADILHIHAVGPAIVTPFARLLGLKVVMTHHGPDYERDKWGRLARFVLKTGERMGARFASRIIAISPQIRQQLIDEYGRTDTALIPNGVVKPVLATDDSYISSLGLEKGRYVLAVGRFVKEKNFHQLVEAFSRLAPQGIKLAIAGDADHPDEYSEHLKQMAREAGVVLAGFVKGEKLRQLLSHARLFVLPSSHEGLPIALLEAMSYERDVLVSDIPANCLPELDKDDIFPMGDVDALAAAIDRKLSLGRTSRTYDLSRYDWQNIARQTLEVYRDVVKR